MVAVSNVHSFTKELLSMPNDVVIRLDLDEYCALLVKPCSMFNEILNEDSISCN